MNSRQFAAGEYYHVYNRGVDKRTIVQDTTDSDRFLQSLDFFNSTEPIGSIFEHKSERFGRPTSKLCKIVCYCLNPDHYHLLLQEITHGGISEFMKRLGGGYTKYFNEKYKRSGSLFQGKYKSIHISDNSYLLHLSAYINLNFKVHKIQQDTLVRSSWSEYTAHTQVSSTCHKNVILDQFTSTKQYISFSHSAINLAKEAKDREYLE